MQRKATTIVFVLALIALVSNIAIYAQQHDNHAEHQNNSSAAASAEEDVAIFCPTMKTGQLCTHGTSNVLELTGAKQEKWVEMARKYNRAVDAATLALFKDSQGVLTSEQQTLLKAWFAVGLNPQMNQLLYSKGLGPKKK